jgi:predicted methyltransferase
VAGCASRNPEPEVATPDPQELNEKFYAVEDADDVTPWVERFESESREIYTERAAIVAALEVRPGSDVADVGAGTGLFTGLLAEAVGPEGHVYAVDIVAPFLERIAVQAREAGHSNVSTVLCTAKSAELAPASVDLAFVCDTYHHFEYPEDTARSLHAALRPGGRLAVIDFERIEGVSDEWVMGHVRAGKETVTGEIEAAGFEKAGEIEIPGLVRNYFLVFRKSD